MPSSKTNQEKWQEFGKIATKFEMDGVPGSLTLHFSPGGVLETVDELRRHRF